MHKQGQGTVRRMDQADLAQALVWRNDPAVRRHLFTQHAITLEEHHAWFGRASHDPRKHLLIVEVDLQAVGFVAFNERGASRVADWGFYAAPEAPRGTGRTLGRCALAHAFEVLQLHKVCGEVLAANTASLRLHQHLGFHQEGVLRQQHFDGARHHDVVVFGLLAAEWQHHCTE
jgi:UDP-4-amino-4,6-dideoxy-N-acetyl-beta-L-altrosamine N-acetyltransferase